MKGSHEGVAHRHLTHVTFMCMYARTFTCMFRNYFCTTLSAPKSIFSIR